MIVSKQIEKRMCSVILEFNTKEQFDEEFKSIIKSFLTQVDNKIEPLDIFQNLFVAFIACGKLEEFLRISKIMSKIDPNELVEFLKEAGDE